MRTNLTFITGIQKYHNNGESKVNNYLHTESLRDPVSLALLASMSAQGFYIFSGLFLYIASALDNSIGLLSLPIWLAAFMLVKIGSSVIFSALCLVSSASFHYMSLDSTELIQSVFLPWIFGTSFVVIFLFLFFKHHTPGGITGDAYNDFDSDGGSGSDADGGGGGGDGD